MKGSYLFPRLLRLADILPHGVNLLHGHIHLLLFVAELTGHLLLLGPELCHALVELGKLLQGPFALLMGVFEFFGLGFQSL